MEELKPCKFRDYPYGLFAYNGELYFKSKYRGSAYSITTGEFWFGETIFLEDIQNLVIQPIKYGEIKSSWNRRAKLENEPQQLCNEDENFIQTKFGYCFYTLDSNPLIYNLYVHPQYRCCGHSNTLLRLAIGRIRANRYKGDIRIQVEPRENSIGLEDLTKYYKSMGLIVEACKPKGE